MKRGFTLIELLVVIAILAILTTVVFVALNPAKRFIDTRNSRRWTDVDNILTAVHTCIVDNTGSVIPCVGTLTVGTVYEIVTDATACTPSTDCTGIATACVDLHSTGTLLAPYLKSLPLDPGGTDGNESEYTISVNAAGLYTIGSCSAENTTIEVSR